MQFESYPSTERHIDNLLALGYLFGIREQAQILPREAVLEIACGTGSLSIAQALSHPVLSWTGIDRDAKAIQEARQKAEELGLSHLHFTACDFKDFAPAHTFSIIIAHGIYTWIPKEDARHLLSRIEQSLSDDGLAYISFNSSPGWDLRGKIAKELQAQASADASKSAEEQVLELRKVLSARRRALQLFSDYAHLTEDEELEQLEKQPDAYLFHELLNPHSHALTLHELYKELHAHGLHVICDAKLARMKSLDPFSMGVAESHAGRLEQEAKSLTGKNTPFRGMLIAKKARLPDIDSFAKKIDALYLSSPMVPESETPDIFSRALENFVSPAGEKVSFSYPLVKASLLVLRNAWPKPMRFHEIMGLAAELLGGMPDDEHAEAELRESVCKLLFDGFLDCFVTSLCIAQTRDKAAAKAFPFAVLQSRAQDWVTNLRGEYAMLSPIEKYVLALCDGTRDIRAIREHILGDVQEGKLSPRDEGGNLLQGDALKSYLSEELRFLLRSLQEKALLYQSEE